MTATLFQSDSDSRARLQEVQLRLERLWHRIEKAEAAPETEFLARKLLGDYEALEVIERALLQEVNGLERDEAACAV
jgi:primosomal protein N''